MKAHFLVSQCNGDLFDTRRENWHKLPPLRARFEYVERNIENTLQLRAALRVPYAWPGGYELFYCTSDGGALCHKCAKDNYRLISDSVRRRVNDGWRIVAVECANVIEAALYCDHCNRAIVEEEDAPCH